MAKVTGDLKAKTVLRQESKSEISAPQRHSLYPEILIISHVEREQRTTHFSKVYFQKEFFHNKVIFREVRSIPTYFYSRKNKEQGSSLSTFSLSCLYFTPTPINFFFYFFLHGHPISSSSPWDRASKILLSCVVVTRIISCCLVGLLSL